MNKTKIEWVKNPDGTQGYTWNPIKGKCPVGCYYCYAHRIYDRFGWDSTIRLDEKELTKPCKVKIPNRIFVGSMIELFGKWNKYGWMGLILATIKRCPHHTFIFLTKQPEIMAQFKFPENCWIGVSVDTQKSCNRIDELNFISNDLIPDNLKFVSFEPLLGLINPSLRGLEWVIIGGMSGERNKERIKQRQEWAEPIIKKAKDLNIPLFIKDNLHYPDKIQEFPNTKSR